MAQRCEEILDELVTLAEGREAPTASAHVATCKSCQKRLAEFRQILSAAQLPTFDAPTEWVMRAKAIMPTVPRRNPLRLLASSFSQAGARSATQDFQLVVGSDETSLRVMYLKGANAWEVMGRAPGAGYFLLRDGSDEALDEDGRFRFEAPDLASTGFSLVKGEERLDIPAAEELLPE